MMRNSLLLALALLLAGCAGMRIPGAPETGLEERQVIDLIDYTQRVAAMSAEQQRLEYNASNQAFAKDKGTMNRMRLAFLLAIPSASFHDTARAANLLEPVTASAAAASPLRSLARLLYAQLNERAGEQKRTSQMHEQLEALKEADRNMREKLDALKEIERSIMQRGQESLPRRR